MGDPKNVIIIDRRMNQASYGGPLVGLLVGLFASQREVTLQIK